MTWCSIEAAIVQAVQYVTEIFSVVLRENDEVISRGRSKTYLFFECEMTSRNKKKSVLLIGPLPPPIGGDTVTTLILTESRYWAENDITVSLINTSAGSRVRLYEEKLSAGDVLRGIRIVTKVCVKLPSADAALLWANSRFLLTAGLAIILLCRLFRKPLIVKLIGTSLVQRMDECGRSRSKFSVAILNKVTYMLAETNAFVDWLVNEAGLSTGTVVWVPNLLPDGTFRESYAKKHFTGDCIFVGQVKREKGIFDIIEALRGRSDLSCDFYGQLVDRDRELFLGKVAELDNVRYEGVIEPGVVSDIISRYGALLLPTYHGGEGYPAVILEAFAAGVPVVTTEWLSIPEIVEDGVKGVLVPVKSPEKIREAIDRLLADQDLYESIAHNAFEYVKSFSEKEVIRNTIIAMIEKIWEGSA